MYSIPPGIVSVVFLFYGLFVLNKKGISRVSISFLILCISTFFWQFCWTILFQLEDAAQALILINIGWLLILFLPTSLYHFLTEITGHTRELKFVYVSYVIAGLLSGVLLSTDFIIDGYYEYSFGFYPKAGILHFLHVMQTVVVVNRGLYVTYRKWKIVQGVERLKLKYCILGVLIYFFAAVDYLCNYGFEFYPPGVLFIAISLGIIAAATINYHLMESSRILAASIAHEMRTPLATVDLQAQTLRQMLPKLIDGYCKASSNNLIRREFDEHTLDLINSITDEMIEEVRRSNQAIDMFLALTSEKSPNRNEFELFSAYQCVETSVAQYPFRSDHKNVVMVEHVDDFKILGSPVMLKYVIHNLIKNALHSIEKANEKERKEKRVLIEVSANKIEVTDSGIGIPAHILPHVFDMNFSTKSGDTGSGIGLSFCHETMRAFGGSIHCESVANEYAKFILKFKPQR